MRFVHVLTAKQVSMLHTVNTEQVSNMLSYQLSVKAVCETVKKRNVEDSCSWTQIVQIVSMNMNHKGENIFS